MDARFYRSNNLNINQLATDLQNLYRSQGYQAQEISNGNQIMVQLRKGGDLEALLGMQAALTVTFQRTGSGVAVAIGQQKWVDKAAVGVAGLAIPPLWPLMITAGFGAFRQASLASQVLNVIDGLVHQQEPEAQAGPAPSQA
ncbi:MAG TPA: hypothetical protein VKV40_06400 [Ktedonobacteraceae bacterium]|nr:hypothetical protein [Ktedonobacteraceae bacterium]